MKWIHIQKQQPKHGQEIVHLEIYDDGHFAMRVIHYIQYGPWEDIVKFCIDSNLSLFNYWWIPVEDFPLPKGIKDEVV